VSRCCACGTAHTFGHTSEPWQNGQQWCPACRAYTKPEAQPPTHGRRFDGETYSHELDGIRLKGQLLRVFNVLKDGYWVSLEDIARLANAPGASVSARLRDLRKEKFGGYTVHRKNKGGGLWVYRLEMPGPARPEQGSLL
jgi:hypothetical protein